MDFLCREEIWPSDACANPDSTGWGAFPTQTTCSVPVPPSSLNDMFTTSMFENINKYYLVV